MRYIIKSLDKSKLVKKIIIDKNGKKTTKWVSREQFEKDKKKTAKKEVKKPVKKEAKKVISKKSAKLIIDKRKITVKKKEPLKSDKKIAKLIKKVTPETRNKTINKILGTTGKKKTVKQAAQDLVKNTPFEKDIQKAIDQFKPIQVPNSTALDYTHFPQMAITNVKAKDILLKQRPVFIPEVDEYSTDRSRYFLPFVEITENKYMVMIQLPNTKKNIVSKYAIMTLDELAVTNNYYFEKAKAEKKIYLDEKIKEALKPDSNYRTDPMYRFTFKTDEKIIAYVTKNVGKVSRNKKDTMGRSQYDLIQSFYKISGNSETWKKFHELNNKLRIKTNDIEIQTEDFDSTYVKGRDTSYGDSNTKNTILKSHGVLVKRQNGDEITNQEINHLKTALDDVYKVFGNRKSMSEKFGLKISHAGEKMMHARKACGLFYPSMKAIGVSFMGKTGTGLTLAHEFGHFMDYYVGKSTKNHYSSDNPTSLANKIASTFRKKMFNGGSATKYYDRTCECFARAMETYHAHKTGSAKYFDEQNYYVRSETFKVKIMSLIDQFFKENDKLLKSLFN